MISVKQFSVIADELRKIQPQNEAFYLLDYIINHIDPNSHKFLFSRSFLENYFQKAKGHHLHLKTFKMALLKANVGIQLINE